MVLVLSPALSLGTPVAAAVCDNAPLPGDPTVKVLVMGDSLTQEFEGDYTWRYRFWQAERTKGVNIAFVGPFTALMPWWAPGGVSGYTDYADPCFNQQHHFATGGKDMAATLDTRACPFDSQVRSEVACATLAYQPDVVLDFMGYNDLKPAQDGQHGYTATQLLATVKSFIAQVRTVSPTVPVAVANVLSTKAPQIVVDATTYNAELKTALADPTTFATGPVGLVDVTKDWKGAPSDTWDGYHPNATGEMHLAWDVADGLHGLGLVSDLDRPIPAVPLGPQTPGVVSLSGTTSSVHVTWTFPLGSDREVLYQRDVTTGTGWTKAQDEPQTLAYDETGMAAHLYEFRAQAARGSVVASDSAGVPIYSAPVQADLRPMPRIQGSGVVAGYHQATVSWSPAAAADRYQVRWRRSGATLWSTGTTTATSYQVAGLSAGATYSFTVAPVRNNIVGGASAAGSTVVGGTVNAALPRPGASAVSRHRIRVTWRHTSTATRYQVLIRPAGGQWRTLGWSTSTSLTSHRLTRGRTYAVAVVAWDSYLSGRRSAITRVRVR